MDGARYPESFVTAKGSRQGAQQPVVDVNQLWQRAGADAAQIRQQKDEFIFEIVALAVVKDAEQRVKSVVGGA